MLLRLIINSLVSQDLVTILYARRWWMWVWLLTQGTGGHGVPEKSDERAVQHLREGGTIGKPRPLPRPLMETIGTCCQLFQLLRANYLKYLLPTTRK